jgi:hypothetical protein
MSQRARLLGYLSLNGEMWNQMQTIPSKKEQTVRVWIEIVQTVREIENP